MKEEKLAPPCPPHSSRKNICPQYFTMIFVPLSIEVSLTAASCPSSVRPSVRSSAWQGETHARVICLFFKWKITEVYCEHKSTFSLSIATYSKSLKEISHFSLFFIDFLRRFLLFVLRLFAHFSIFLSSSIYFLYCLCVCMCAFSMCVCVFVCVCHSRK